MKTDLLANAPFLAAAAILFVGVAIVLFRRNLLRILMGMSLVEAAVNLFLVALGYRHDAVAPIYTNAPEGAGPATMVLPTVQALTLTAIVIGLATTAMMLAMVLVIHRKTGTLNVNEMRRLRE
jgi:multicomponent Na+:H+ antiporter subunit C